MTLLTVIKNIRYLLSVMATGTLIALFTLNTWTLCYVYAIPFPASVDNMMVIEQYSLYPGS